MPQPEKPKYPMLERNADKSCEWDAIRGFIDWIHEEHRIVFARWSGRCNDRLEPALESLDKLIAEFLEIDPDQLEAERRALIEELRNP